MHTNKNKEEQYDKKKLIAGLSASVMAIAASATSVSAFADEVNLVQEQQELQTYVDSFAAEDENLYEIATYLSDNDFSLEETKQIMERCENSQDEMAEIVAAQSSGLTCFHNTSRIIPITQCVIFVQGPYVGGEDLKADISYPTGFTPSSFWMNDYVSTIKETHYFKDYSTCIAYNAIDIAAGDSEQFVYLAASSYPSSMKNERNLMRNIKATYHPRNEDDENIGVVSFATGCYYIGDLNHDGNIDDLDATFLAKYLNGSVSFGGKYLDVSSEEAEFLRYCAADVNRDGKVDDQDLLRLNKYLAGLIYPL